MKYFQNRTETGHFKIVLFRDTDNCKNAKTGKWTESGQKHITFCIALKIRKKHHFFAVFEQKKGQKRAKNLIWLFKTLNYLATHLNSDNNIVFLRF